MFLIVYRGRNTNYFSEFVFETQKLMRTPNQSYAHSNETGSTVTISPKAALGSENTDFKVLYWLWASAA